MKMPRILLLIVLGMCFMVSACVKDYPTRQVTVIIPYTEGSATDVIARTMGNKLSELWGQPVVFENHPGAGSTVGAGVVAKAPADGYTLYISSSSHAVSPALYAALPYDPKKDFSDIAPLATQAMVLIAGPEAGVKSLSELIEAAKAAPGEMKFGSPGTGSAAHLAAEKLKSAAGIDVVHVPFKGGPGTIAATRDGSVAYSFLPLSITLKGIGAGELVPLGVSSKERSPKLPDVPTIEEAGLGGFEATVWWGVWAPAGIPPGVKDKLAKDVASALASQEVIDEFKKGGFEPMSMSPEEFSKFVSSEMEAAARAVRDAGIEPK